MDAEGNGIYSSLYREKTKIQENENPSHALHPFICVFLTNIQLPSLLLSGEFIFD